jgi:hypothetical protein
MRINEAMIDYSIAMEVIIKDFKMLLKTQYRFIDAYSANWLCFICGNRYKKLN